MVRIEHPEIKSLAEKIRKSSSQGKYKFTKSDFRDLMSILQESDGQTKGEAVSALAALVNQLDRDDISNIEEHPDAVYHDRDEHIEQFDKYGGRCIDEALQFINGINKGDEKWFDSLTIINFVIANSEDTYGYIFNKPSCDLICVSYIHTFRNDPPERVYDMIAKQARIITHVYEQTESDGETIIDDFDEKRTVFPNRHTSDLVKTHWKALQNSRYETEFLRICLRFISEAARKENIYINEQQINELFSYIEHDDEEVRQYALQILATGVEHHEELIENNLHILRSFHVQDPPEILIPTCEIITHLAKRRKTGLNLDSDFINKLQELRSHQDTAVRAAVEELIEHVDLLEVRDGTVQIIHEGEGDVLAGGTKDASTQVTDSVINRSDIGSTDSSNSTISYCPDCGESLEEFPNSSFCPHCGFSLH